IAWLNKGSVFAALGKNNEALQTYGRCISINPKCAKAWYGKGLVLQMLGRTKEADAAFAKAKELELAKENDFDPY
ncbi:MAG TPA: tetratricopeptide repeat protein, partial [Methanothrix sp.]|nr:tetratricopeptide repeat protein [Methanothrix sp.]